MKKSKIALLFLPVLTLIFGYMIYTVYGEVKHRTIDEFNNQQMILAKQAARGIESFFNYYGQGLTFLSKLDGIIDMNAQGETLIKAFYEHNAAEMRAVTRVDARGRIMFTVPQNEKAIGADISGQAHVRAIMQTHKPVISEVFSAVQGYEAVACHVPVMEDGNYRGSLAVLIPFNHLVKKYIENISIGKSGHARVISREGRELYNPVSENIGRSVFETYSGFPSVLAMFRKMIETGQGTASYRYRISGGAQNQIVEYCAAYAPISLGNTFWSVVVATPQAEVLDNLRGFRNRLFLVAALMMAVAVAYAYYALKAWSFVKEEARRKKTEAALQESEKKYRQLVENANDLIYRTDPRGHLTYANAKTVKVLEYPEEELIGMHYLEVFQPGSREAGEAFYRRQLKEKISNTYYEFPGMSRSGKTIWLGQNVQLVVKDGEVKGFQAVARDISDRKKMEKELLRSEERYRLLVENTMDGYFICEIPSGRFEFLNQKACELYGYSLQEGLNLTVWDVMSEGDHERIRRRVQRRMAGDHLGSEHEIYTANRKDGSTFRIEIATSLVSLKGRPAVQGIIRDITERERLERQLRQAQRMESIGTLAGGVAHDFNNILSPIIGYTELSLGDLPPESPIRGNLNEIIKAAERAKSLVRQILTFSRMADLELKPLKIQTVIKEVLKLVRASLPSTIEIRQKINSACGPVMADATQIHQMIMNLITNAYHAMQEKGGRLEVILEERSPAGGSVNDAPMASTEHLCLTVSDTGVGMHKDVMERIFDPYFTTKQKDKGTGLGLSVVHGIVKSYHGRITVSSEPGQGSKFTVCLPVIKTAAQTTERTVLTQLPRGNEHILLVDDEVEIVRMEKRMLQRLGYQVTDYSASTEALAAFRDHPGDFDLVISDLTMPGMTGDRLAEELIKIRSDTPVIICTGFSNAVFDRKRHSSGISDVLMKPVAMRDLADSIRHVLDGERAE